MITSKSGPSLATYAAGKIVADELPSTSGTASAVAAGNGTVSAPSIAFINSTGSGLYRIGADDIGFAIAGTKTLEFKAAGMGIINGTASAPSIFANAENTTGAYFATGVFGITAAGTQVANFSAVGVLNNVAGTVSAPSYSYVANTNTGQYMTGTTTTSALNYACNGVLQGSWTTAGVLVKAGSAAAPSLCLGTSTTTGWYQDTTSQWTWSSNGVQKVNFATSTVAVNSGRSTYELAVLDQGASYALRVTPGSTGGAVGLGGNTDNSFAVQISQSVAGSNIGCLKLNQATTSNAATQPLMSLLGAVGAAAANTFSSRSAVAGAIVGWYQIVCPSSINSGVAWCPLYAAPVS